MKTCNRFINTTVTVLFAIFLSLHLPAQVTPNYEITGHIGGLKEHEIVYVGPAIEASVPVPEDTDYVKDGNFHLKGHVYDGPRQFQVRIPETGKIIRLFLDSGDHVVIECPDIKLVHHGWIDHNITIEGSRSNFAMNCLIPALLLYSQNESILNNYLKSLRDSVGFDPLLVGAIVTLKNQITDNFYGIVYNTDDFQNRPAFAAVASYLHNNLDHSPLIELIYNGLDAHEKNSIYGKQLKEKFPLITSKPFPLFTLPDVNGKQVALKDILSKNKITLVNFWSLKSAGIGKDYMDEVLTMYNKFHSKGLSVVSVSSDTLDYEWKGYVRKQKFPWIDVSDLKGEYGIVGTVYHEFGEHGTDTPNITHVLIDNQGKIIAWDPTGLELQYYLWKYLGQ